MMKRATIGTLVALLSCNGAYASEAGGSFQQMVADTGCAANHTDARKLKLFNERYLNREMTVTGIVSDVTGDTLMLKVMPATTSYDVTIKMTNTSGLEDIDKGNSVTVRLVVDYQGGCIMAYGATNGALMGR